MTLLVLQLVCWLVVKDPRRFKRIEKTRRLGNSSCLKVQVMIRFLWAKNKSASDMHSQIGEVYGEEAMNRQHVAKWCHYFPSCRQDVENSNRVGNGRQVLQCEKSTRRKLKKL
ncbi:hypothetical protein TNCV_4357121 [Trichonephila clavipes]|nr:hypothetical protein TNCV_4357121 [Trichonephila clavipes]